MSGIRVIAVALAVLLGGCERSAPPEDLSAVAAEVETAVWSFHSADTARDASRVVGLLAPDFHMLVDGRRLGYDDVVSGTQEFMSGLSIFATEWSDLRITPIDGHHAISSFLFRDSIVTKDGALVQSRGPTTLVWAKQNGEWRIIYADADHYPIDSLARISPPVPSDVTRD